MKSVRTDLAMEAASAFGTLPQGVEMQQDDSHSGMSVTRVRIIDKGGEETVGKPMGSYITIQAPKLTGRDAALVERVSQVFAAELQALMGQRERQQAVLIVGLGNRAVTPDSLGPRVVDHIAVTRHMFALLPEQVDSRMTNVCAIAPGVLGETGMESEEVIRALVERIQPAVVIAIDSLAAMSVQRLATTIQLADTGITPGAGVGNKRPRLDQSTLRVPVIAIGVPLVVHGGQVREELEELILTPKEIDAIAEDCAVTLANGINLALHPGLTFEETVHYLHN